MNPVFGTGVIGFLNTEFMKKLEVALLSAPFLNS